MKKVIGLVFCFSVFTVQAQTAQNIVKVTVDGFSYLGEVETIKTAKERAMLDAEQKAVEKGTEIYVESYTKVHNSMLVDDDILSVAAGYLLNKRVLVDRLESDPPRYHIQIEAEVKCGDLDKLITAKKAEKEIKQQPISLDFVVMAERKMSDGSWGEVLLKDGGALRSHDKFQIFLKPGMDCYVYLLFYDSEGKASLLYPEKGSVNYVGKNQKVLVPGLDLYYELDNKTGQETIYLIASFKPMPDVEWLLEKMEKAGNQTQLAANMAKSIKSRGIGNIVKGEKTDFKLTDGKKIEKITEQVMGKGAVVRVLSFMHQP